MVKIDIPMPSCCEECPLEQSDDYGVECILLYKGYTEKVREYGKLERCPLKGADDE